MKCSGWKLTDLKSEVDLLTGHPFKSTDYTENVDDILLLRGDNIAQGYLRWDGVKRWSSKKIEELESYFLKEDDLVVAMDRPWIESGLKYAYVSPKDLPSLLVQRVSRLRANKSLNQTFLRYIIGSRDFTNHVLSIQTGTAVPHISSNQIKEFEFFLPPLEEQKRIADVLSYLDAKIDNLRRQNQTLEEIARSIFKHWFIDFEFPNADGKPYKSSGGAMVRSDLGDIPEGWRVGKLGDLITINPRESIKKGKIIKFVDMRSLSTSSMEITDYINREATSGSKFRNEDTLLARITPCLENGKTAFVSILDGDEVALGSTEFLVLRSKDNCCPEYIYTLARSPYFRDFAIKNMTGSSGRQRIPTDVVSNYKLCIPNIKAIKDYQELCHSLFLKTGSNQKQLQTLTKTRDTLLPKLMSGQLRVRE